MKFSLFFTDQLVIAARAGKVLLVKRSHRFDRVQALESLSIQTHSWPPVIREANIHS
jgi:hypothetical protein